MTWHNMINLEAYAQFFDLRYSPTLLRSIVHCTMRKNKIERHMDECDTAAFYQQCISRKVKSIHAQAYDVFTPNEKPMYKLFRKF